MLRQLQSLYRQLNLPEEEFLKFKEKATALARQKTAEKIISKFGSQKGKEFTLKDLQGQSVSISSLKNKVVVIDSGQHGADHAGHHSWQCRKS